MSYLESVTMETTEEESIYLGSVDSSEPVSTEEPIIFGSADSSLPVSTDQNRARNVPWNKLAAGLYIVFLLWQFPGNVLYVVRVGECSTDKLNHSIVKTLPRFPFQENCNLP